MGGDREYFFLIQGIIIGFFRSRFNNDTFKIINKIAGIIIIMFAIFILAGVLKR